MMLFTKQNKKLNRLEEVRFDLEADLQHLVEENMDAVLEIDFVKSELAIRNFRIDTIGFDRDAKSFVIVEYKRDKNQSVIDQGMAYMSLLLENKADFVLAYNEKFEKPIRKEDVDWTQSRIVFIARSFTAHQKQASGFKDLPIDLYEARSYKNGTILFNPITIKNTESINTFKRKKQNDKLSGKIKTYVESDHLNNVTPKTKKIYMEIKQIMESLDDDIQIILKKMAIMFKTERGFAWVVLRKNTIEILLKVNSDILDDPNQIVQDVTNVGHWGGGNSRIKIADLSELSHVRDLLKQAYSKFK